MFVLCFWCKSKLRDRNMKKIVLLSSLLAMVGVAANADYRTVYTDNCDPAAMHALLERESRIHRAVITEVICSAQRAIVEPVAGSFPVYEPVYVEPAYDLSNIPVVDCVPYPTRCEYCGGLR